MWYVIQVMTGKEDDIAGKLKEQGIRALVPKENRLIRSGGSWSQREYILFAGYVFLNMNYNADNYYTQEYGQEISMKPKSATAPRATHTPSAVGV